MNLTRRQLLKSATAVAAVATFPAIAAKAQDDSIALATLWDRSGGFEVYGSPMNELGALAVEEINAAGGLLGRPIRHIAYDPQSNMQLYPQFAQEAVLREKAAVVMGGITSPSREAIRPFLRRNRTLQWYPTIYEGGVCDINCVNTGTTSYAAGRPLIKWGIENHGPKIFGVWSDYSAPRAVSALTDIFADEFGGEQIEKHFFPVDVSEFGPVISRIQRAKPDFVFSGVSGGPSIGFYRQWYAAGMKDEIPIVSNLFGLGNEHLQVTPEEGDDIVLAASYFQELDTPANKAFLQRVAAKQGPDHPYVNVIALGGYEAVMMWAELIKRAGTLEYDGVIETLRKGFAWDGPAGRIAIDPKTNNAIRDVYLAKIKNRVWEIVSTFEQVPPGDMNGKCDLIANPNDTSQYEI
jgi:branched-chain amino acid transport system substrate-binding protein